MAADPRCPSVVLNRVLATRAAHELAHDANLTMSDLRTDLSDIVLIALDGAVAGKAVEHIVVEALTCSTALRLAYLSHRTGWHMQPAIECFVAVSLADSDLVTC